ncbi:hypothetical protein KSC_043530 [Ktedonobacter sp. SOSP1-52]|uniref:tyrosine-type recombinase/integrase n=1 Tax=Ktedonobacter sp. SOSP1-52 TaxID=2778366 RepID=UPI00191576AA|nr:tyrosine-type recombinase/integrase [Ktedonobacter sp. SOSP1-52]GHO65461.1 hypothetical protein KSC_043530 [Ktedonobacter sp. SOSP1-52]
MSYHQTMVVLANSHEQRQEDAKGTGVYSGAPSSIPEHAPTTLEEPYDHMRLAIELWLLEKYSLTQSKCTEATYRDILISLHTHLQDKGLSLNHPAEEIVSAILCWASARTPGSKRQGDVAPSTYNQRVAAVSSFYRWAIQNSLYTGNNPVEQLPRATIQKYAKASSLNPQLVSIKLNAIDRSTPRGSRDYVLLQVALNTGRSSQELASLTWQCIRIEGDGVVLTFKRCRGGKIMQDLLDARLSHVFLAYIRTIYGEQLEALAPTAPIWVSFSDRSYGQSISSQTIADICESHLGISTVRTLRHTFALTMDGLGAHISTIQERLGHESAAITTSYIHKLKKSYNPHATVLADVFGLEEPYTATRQA